MDYFAHETACIDEGAEIGAGTRIWHFTHIMSGARLGRGCNVGQNVFVQTGVVIGDHVKLQNNVFLPAGVTVEDHVFFGPVPQHHLPARRDDRRQRDDRVRHDDWPVCVCRRGIRGHARRRRLHACLWQPCETARLGLPVRREAHVHDQERSARHVR
jgi:hypothetical protein